MADPLGRLAWDDFRLVKAVAEARTLPAAATQLGVNHSTVFRRLTQIERALGRPLFERHRAGYAPTPAGEEMIALAARLDADIAGFARRLAGQAPAPAGEVRITTNDSLLADMLIPLFARFRERYPEITLDIVLTNAALNLSRRDADVAIRATETPPETLVGRRVARIGWALYGRRADLADMGDRESVCARNWISLADTLAGLKTMQFMRAGAPADRIVYKVDTVLGLAEAVEQGIGIGYLPCFIGDKRTALKRLNAGEVHFAAGLWLLTHADLRHAPRVRALMDFLGEEMGRLRGLVEGEEQRHTVRDDDRP